MMKSKNYILLHAALVIFVVSAFTLAFCATKKEPPKISERIQLEFARLIAHREQLEKELLKTNVLISQKIQELNAVCDKAGFKIDTSQEDFVCKAKDGK